MDRKLIFYESIKTNKAMCRFKDTNLGVKKLDFNQKRGMMAVYFDRRPRDFGSRGLIPGNQAVAEIAT